jgi:hypothetical protein
MTNKLGYVRDAPHNAGHRYIEVTASAIELPESLKGIPDGFIVYVDRDGQLQVMDGDPNE